MSVKKNESSVKKNESVDQSQNLQNVTVLSSAEAEITIRRSRFIGYLFPVESKQQVVTKLEQLRAVHWSAVHHCYAYRIGQLGMEYRMSDDGEPSGTAGKPILFALQKARITNALLIVVRYFGGVKLGVGPLAKAYLESANLVIAKSDIRPLVSIATLDVHCTYDDVSRIIEVFEEVGAQYEAQYSDAVMFLVTTDETTVQFITEQVIERTSGRAGFSNVIRNRRPD